MFFDDFFVEGQRAYLKYQISAMIFGYRPLRYLLRQQDGLQREVDTELLSMLTVAD